MKCNPSHLGTALLTGALPIVVIDARMIGPVPHGIARYVTALASGLSALSRQTALSYRPVFLVTRSFRERNLAGFETLPLASGFLSLRELIEIPSALKGIRASLYHSPSFSSLFSSGPLRPPCPWIVTIHDLNHLTYGGAFQKAYYRHLLKTFALRASALATVSEFSRDEIASWLGIDRQKIEVVCNALEPGLREAPSAAESEGILSRFGLKPGRYFFCLSNPKPHKNIPFLLEAYQEFARSQPGAWPLAMALSMEGLADQPGVLGLGALRDDEVRVLRSHAGAVVFPSLYEGFGLPPVEAALAGAPVIVSKIPPHQEGLAELGEDEARWIDPRDRRSLSEALRAAQEGRLRAASPESRRRIAERFSELALARHMDQIYRRVLHPKA